MLNRNQLLKWFNLWAIIICLMLQSFTFILLEGNVLNYFFLYASGLLAINQYVIARRKDALAFFIFLLTLNSLVFLFDEGFYSSTAGFVFYIPLVLGLLILANPSDFWQRASAVFIPVLMICLVNFTDLTPKLSNTLYTGPKLLFLAAFNTLSAIVISLVIVFVLSRAFSKAHRQLLEGKMMLERSEQLLNSINHNIDIAICRTDVLSNRILYLNNANISMFGYDSLEEMLSLKPDDLYANAEEREKVVHEINENGMVKEREVLYRRKDGSTFWGLLTSTKTIDVNGRLIFDGALRDITNIKKLTSELVSAKETAEKSSLAKSQFLSSISHEIRTPMNAVIGASNLLLMDNPKPEQVENILLLHSAGTNLMRLINNVLDFSKIELGKIELETVPVDLLHLIKEILSTHRIEASRKNIQLTLNTSISHAHYLVDPLRLTQVLNNLLSNALKFTDSGEVVLSVAYQSEGEESDTVFFEVKDTGIGIAAERQEKVFESFSQEEVETTRKFGGTGLGLAITRDILMLMGSAINVRSRKGEGSAFSFTLSLKKHKTPIVEDRINNTEKDFLKGMKVLVVEDNKINIAIIRKFLVRWQIECTVAESGEAALAMVKNEVFELILMDLHMPGMDGYQTAEAIRAKGIKTPIFALTADAFNETRISALACGMNDFIPKPFDPIELHQKLVNVRKNQSYPL